MAVKPARPSPGKKREDERTTGVKSRVTPGRVQPSPARPSVGTAPYIPPNLTPRPASPPDNFTPMTQEPDLLPPQDSWQPEPAPRQSFTPFVDPTRSDRGLTLWRGPQGNAVQTTDLFPNFQEKLSLITRPSEATEEREGGYTTIGQWLRQRGKAGEIAAGLPEALMAPFTVPAEVAEQMIGMQAQALGVSPRVIQYAQRVAAPGGPIVAAGEAIGTEGVQAVMPFVRRLASGAMRQFAEQAERDRGREFWTKRAEQLETWEDDPTSLEETIALAVVEARRMGRDTTRLERVLEAIAPGRTEQLIDTSARMAAFRGELDDTQTVARSATYAYEGLNRVIEARERLEAGEPWETVQPSIDEALTGRERARDFIGQMLIEPTNAIAVDVVGKVARQGGSAFVRSAVQEGEDVAKAAERVGRELVANQRLAPLSRLERLPVIGPVLRGAAGLPVTESKRIMENSVETVKFLADHITDDAARQLARAGVRVDPFSLLWSLIKDPNAAKVAGTELAGPEVARILGLGEYVVGAKEARVLGVAPGTVVNLLTSERVLQTRHVLNQLGNVGAANFLRQYGDVAEAYRNANRMGRGLPLTQGRRAWRKAMGEANNELYKLLARIQDTADEIAGVRETGLLGGFYQKYRAAQGFMANFHMAMSPGWLIRNVSSNTMQQWSDGIVNLKGLGSLDRYMADNGFEPAIREFGGQADALAGKGRFSNFGMTPLNAQAETNARQRIFVTVIENVFNRAWRRGVGIPEDAVRALEDAVGEDVARAILGRVQQVRSLDQLNAVLGKTKAADLGSALPAELAQRLAQIEPGLDKVVQKLIDDSPDVMTALDDLARLDGKFAQTVDDALKNWYPLRGTADGVAAEDFWRWMQAGGYDETQAREAWDAFNRRRAIFSMAMSKGKQYADALINQIDEVSTELGSQFKTRAMQIAEAANSRYHTEYFAVRDTMLRLVREERWNELHARFPQLAEIGSKSEFYDIWPMLRDSMFADAWRGAFDEFLALGDEVAGALRTQGFEPGYTRPTDSIIQELERIAPATTDQQHQLLYQLSSRAVRDYNVNGTFHLVNILKQAGLLPDEAKFLYASDIASPQWYDEAIAALERRAAQKAMPEEAVREGLSIDDWDDVMRILSGDGEPGTFIPVDAPVDFAQQANAQAMEAKRVITEVVEWLGRVGDEGADLTMEQQRAVRSFLDALKPRLTTTRQYATQAGKLIGDRALFNYEDRRNYDTMASVLFSYPFWYMRNAGRWVTMAWQRPGALAAWLKINEGLREMNYDLPVWWQDQLRLDTPWGVQYMPILNAISPIQGLIGDKFRDAEREHTWYGAALSALGQYGPSINVVPQAMIAMDAALRGEKEEMISWWNYQSQVGRAFTAGTALLHEATGVGPPGGVPTPMEMLTMWDIETGRSVLTRWERNNLMKLGFEMLGNGQIESQEALRDALYRQEGEVWDQLIQQYRVNTSASVFGSLFAGASFHMRPEAEVEVARIDMEVQEIMRRRPGEGAHDAYSEEQYRLAWDDLERRAAERGISLDLMFMSRRSGDEKHERYIWTVMNSLPPSSRDYLEAFGIEPESLNRFYDEQFTGMSPAEKENFISGMFQLGAVLQMPDDATEAEWRLAKDRNQAMREALDREFSIVGGDIFALESSYYDTRDSQGPAAASQFLQDHPELMAFWDRKNEMVAEDPLLVRYYGSIDILERYARAQFEDEMARRFPDLDPDAFWAEYRRRSAVDPEDAAAMWDEYPEMQEYLNEQDRWTLSLGETLEEMGDRLGVLEGQFATMRRDLPDELTPGQSRIKDMIQNSTRPLRDFELPEDLDIRELQAATNLEIASIPDDLYFEVKDRLDEMGNLDSALQSFQNWGRGSGSEGTIKANELEVRALLQGLAAIREEMGYAYAGSAGSKATDTGKGTDARSRTGGGSGGYSGSGGGYGSRRADDDGLLVGMPEGMTMEQYAAWYPSARWATNEVRDIGKYLAATIESGSPLNPSLMSLSADTRTMVQAFLAATQGQQLDPGAVQDYLAAAVGANDPAAGLDALPPALHGPASQLGAAFLAELAERMGGGSSGGGGSRGGRVRSSSYGGASEQPQTEKQENALHMQIHTFMTDLRRRAPTFWNHLRNMANMSESELAAFLSDPANAHFKRWLLEQVYPRYGTQMAALMTYFKERGTPPAASSGYNRPYSRAGASQRWGVNYAA